MKRMTVAVALIAALALPAGAAAKPRPDQANKRAAIAQCKSERGTTKATRKAFKAKYHSMSRCVRQKAAVRENAAKECTAERAAMDAQAFAERYGANKNGKNAFGKCVSSKSREA